MDLKHLKTKLKKAAAKKEADGGEAAVSGRALSEDCLAWSMLLARCCKAPGAAAVAAACHCLYDVAAQAAKR